MPSKIIVSSFCEHEEDETPNCVSVTVGDKEPRIIPHGETQQFYLKNDEEITISEVEVEEDEQPTPEVGTADDDTVDSDDGKGEEE